MKRTTKIFHCVILLVVLTAWAGSLAWTYWQTREKWLDLGRNTGESGGKGQVLQELCEYAIEGAPEEPVVWSLGVKASIVQMTGENGSFTLYCR